MAKAKKPASGTKPTSQTSTTEADKGTGGTDKPTETSAASKAAAAKTDKAVGKPTTAAEKSKSSAAASASKSTTSKAAENTAAKSSTTTKAAQADKSDTPKTSDTSKPAAAKADEAKRTAASKAADAKSDDEASSTKASPSAATSKDARKPEPKENSAKPPSTPTPRSEPAPQKAPEKSGSVFWPLVLGGVIAGALGFAASEMNVFNTRVETDDLRAAVEQQQEQIAALENAEPVVMPEAPDLSAIEADLASIAENIATVEVRLTALENRPTPSGDVSAPTADYSEELAALTASVEAQKAEIDRLLENALSIEEATAESARRAAIQGALTKISSALNAGGSYADAVEELSNSGVDDVPDAIAAPADGGVATLQSLQADFPDTARSALAAARSAGVDGDQGGMASFLRRQLGARSVAPREGSDPDAVLSRAEAAMQEGRLADALSELEALPPESQAAIENWLSDARTRADAEAAVEDLSQRLTAN